MEPRWKGEKRGDNGAARKGEKRGDNTSGAAGGASKGVCDVRIGESSRAEG